MISLSINSIDQYGGVGDGDIFHGNDLTIKQAVTAIERTLKKANRPDDGCSDVAFDLTITKSFELHERSGVIEIEGESWTSS